MRDLVLPLEAQLVIVAATEIMQETPDLEKHRHACRQIVISRPQLRQPAQHLQVAQPARRVFHIRFQMINRVLKFRVPLVCELDDVLPQIGTRIANLPEQRLVAREQSPVEQTHRQFGVPRINLIAIHRRMHRLTDAQPLIPQIPQKHRQGLFNRELCLLVRRQNQQVDIGIRKQLAAPIPANGQQCHLSRHPLPALPDQFIHTRGTAGDGCGSITTPEEPLADFLFRHFIHCNG
jgi:hypothetical protein